MKKAFAKINVMPRFLVIIASKRHHVRFFPQSGVETRTPTLFPVHLLRLASLSPSRTTSTSALTPLSRILLVPSTTRLRRSGTRATVSASSTAPHAHLRALIPVHPCYHSCLTLPCRVLRPHPLPAAYPVIARTTRDYVAMTQLVLSTTTSFSTSLSGITAYKSTRHTLIYEHSYQYIPEFHRGARQRHRPPSVSLFPAVYYAHIASLPCTTPTWHSSLHFLLGALSHPSPTPSLPEQPGTTWQ